MNFSKNSKVGGKWSKEFLLYVSQKIGGGFYTYRENSQREISFQAT